VRRFFSEISSEARDPYHYDAAEEISILGVPQFKYKHKVRRYDMDPSPSGRDFRKKLTACSLNFL
jgi:hypothetical protein